LREVGESRCFARRGRCLPVLWAGTGSSSVAVESLVLAEAGLPSDVVVVSESSASAAASWRVVPEAAVVSRGCACPLWAAALRPATCLASGLGFG